jgi:hypothetical protein
MKIIGTRVIFLLAFLIAVIIILLLTMYYYTFDKTYNRYLGYYVVAKYHDREKAALILQDLNKFGITLIGKMYDHYKNNDEAMVIINRLMNNYNPDSLQENDPIFTIGHKAYTMNFAKIAICLRHSDGAFYDMDTLKFVFLHELAHVGSIEKEHNDIFWRIFKYILVCASKFIGYMSVDYSQYPIVYCGIKVSQNPYNSEYDISQLVTTGSRGQNSCGEPISGL